MPEQQPKAPLIWEQSEEEIVRYNSQQKKWYSRGRLSHEEYARRVSDDASLWLHLFQFVVTADNWQEVGHLDAADWQLLESRLVPGGEWWYVADFTFFFSYGLLIQVREGKIVDRTRRLFHWR